MGKELEFMNGARVLGALPLSVQVVAVKCFWLDFRIERITAWGTGSNSGRGTKILQALQGGQKNKKELRGLKRPFKSPNPLQSLTGLALTCVHLIHVAEEVLRGRGDAVAPQPQAAVRALLPRMIRPPVEQKMGGL